jgi:hypothetical protein
VVVAREKTPPLPGVESRPVFQRIETSEGVGLATAAVGIRHRKN